MVRIWFVFPKSLLRERPIGLMGNALMKHYPLFSFDEESYVPKTYFHKNNVPKTDFHENQIKQDFKRQ